MTVAATVIWLGTPERELWFEPVSPPKDEQDLEAEAQTIRIASIAPFEPASVEEPVTSTETDSPPEARLREDIALADATPDESPRAPEPASPDTERATLQPESDLPEGPPPLEELRAVEPEPEQPIQESELREYAPTAQLDDEGPPLPSEAARLAESAELVPPSAAAVAPTADVGREAAARAGSPLTAPTPAETSRSRPEQRSTPEPVDAVSIAIGRHRIEQGRYPHQRASYARVGFERYRDAMLALGGSFYLFDTRARQVIAELDPYSLATRRVDRTPNHLSRWPRDVTRYLGRALTTPEVQQAYRGMSLRVVLLPPSEVDAAFVGGLDRALRKQGLEIERVTQVRLVYELTADGLECEVVKIELRDGTEQSLRLRLALSGPIPRSRGRRSGDRS